MLRPAGDRPRALPCNSSADIAIGRSGMRICLMGRQRDNTLSVGSAALSNELGFTPVPLCKHFSRGCTTQDAWVHQTRKTHTGNVPARAVDTVKVPDGLGRLGIVLVEEAAAILLVEDTREAPWLMVKRLDVSDVDNEHVTWLGASDVEGTGEVVDLGEVHVQDIISAIVVADLSACPVDTFDLDRLARLNGGD